MKNIFIKKLKVSFISLVDKPANRKGIIFKSGDLFQKDFPITKTNNEQRLVYGIVYSPAEVDTQGMFTDADVLKDAAYNFLKEGKAPNIDSQHDLKPGLGFVGESWLLKENDPVFPDEKPGSWGVAIKITDEEVWEKVKCGEITGLSLYGVAELEEVENNSAGKSIIKKISGFFTGDKPLDTLLTKEIYPLFSQIESELHETKSGLNKIENEYHSLKQNTELIEKLNERIEKLENFTTGSRQPKVIHKTTKQNIWL